MAIVVVDDSCLKQADWQPRGLVWGSAAAWRCSTFTRWTVAMTSVVMRASQIITVIHVIGFGRHHSPTRLMMSTEKWSQGVASGQRIRHSTSTPMTMALMTSTTIMKTLKPCVLDSQLATRLGGLNRELMIFTRFRRLSAAVIRARVCRADASHRVSTPKYSPTKFG